MGTGGRRVAHAHLLRAALVALLSLVAFLAPAAGTPAAATSGPGTASGCAAPEVHEELRPGRPERDRSRPELSGAERGTVAGPTGGAAFATVPRANLHLVRTQVEALPHPLARLPIQRN